MPQRINDFADSYYRLKSSRAGLIAVYNFITVNELTYDEKAWMLSLITMEWDAFGSDLIIKEKLVAITDTWEDVWLNEQGYLGYYIGHNPLLISAYTLIG